MALDDEKLWAWNGTIPASIDRCVHEIIKEQTQAHPTSIAVCAWDGNLTYAELDRLSTRLAHSLIQLGVGPEALVPLCFAKSLWAIVAMLGVLKAGGAFVTLDPSQAADRRERVLAQTEAKIVLTSVQYSHLAIGTGRIAIAVGLDAISSISSTSVDGSLPDGSLPACDPKSAAYVIFTSGSTGQPKGVLVEHQAASSSCTYHGRLIGFDIATRAFQFASYTFDASIMEIITTLLFGGCICIPSDSDRLQDIAGCINKMDVNTAFFTPSVARLIEPIQVPSLKSIILGGEKCLAEDFARWLHLPVVMNGYGPTECVVFCCMDRVQVQQEEYQVSIGEAVGSASWIVAADDHDKLVPIGSVGELLVEGPILARGYVADPTKTATVFIEDPAWLLQGGPGYPGRHGRLYKTGDLVRYDEDGKLIYMGRKDNQVKIRGQRVELGEIEHHVSECLPQARQVVAEVVPAGNGGSLILAAFLVLDIPPSQEQKATVFTPSAATEDQLAKRLPAYMVPTIYFAIRRLPLNTSGKTDRKQLRALAKSFAQQHMTELHNARRGNMKKAMSEMEQKLQAIWARVLNVELESIGIDDSFFTLGGDSISAMQVSAAARSLAINISSGNILRNKTISGILHGLQKSDLLPVSPLPAGEELPDKLVTLSPLQQLYMFLQPDGGDGAFDQSFFLKLHRSITQASLVQALESLVQRHAALRTRFTKNADSHWMQHITSDIANSVRVYDLQPVGAAKMQVMAQARESLSIVNGPILAAVLFEGPDHQSLFLTIHHAIIDLVSWRVLFQELEELLTSGTLSLPPPMSFPAWCALQAQYAIENLDPSTSTPFDVRPPLLSYWGMEGDSPLLHDEIKVEQFIIDESTSAAIFGKCNDAFGTRPVELMISALIHSFSLEFPDRFSPPIYSEGHGREPWDELLDISRTIGWFTTLFPVQVPQDATANLLDTIRQTKDCMRALPRNGWPYFTSRFADQNKAKTYASEFPAEIKFNYTGLYQQLERADALFSDLPLPDERDRTSTAERRFALINILVRVERGKILASIDYHNSMYHQQKILSWVKRWEATLAQMAGLLSSRPPEWTVADFPLAFSSYEHIQDFQSVHMPRLGIAQLDDIEDIFPCSPMQEGILISQARDSRNYRTCFRLEIRSSDDASRIELTTLQLAWKAVVRRHALLRCIIIEDFPGSSGMMHIILKDPVPSISYGLHREDGKSIARIQELHPIVGYQKEGLQHHVSIYEVDDKTVYFDLEINHAIVDGFSGDLLLRDLQAAYTDSLDPLAVSYREFILHSGEQPRAAGLEFWTQHLDGVAPCIFPALMSNREISDKDDSSETTEVCGLDAGKLFQFCAEWEVTPATVVQTAWAAVLGQYTRTTTPCFGNLTSGRDIPIKNVEQIFGPLIGMVPSRVRLDRSRSVLETLQKVQEDHLDSLQYQSFPLSAIHSALGLGSDVLFNTALSFQKDVGNTGRTDSEILISFQDIFDPTEYDVVVAAFTTKTSEIQIMLNFRYGFATPTQAARLASCLQSAISAIITDPSMSIQDINLMGESEIEKIWAWNEIVPSTIDRCLHDLVDEQTRAHPSAPAVCAWDGELTYAELDTLSAKLAHHLALDLGVGPEVLVPLCFEKSLWTVVTMLAVLKAGGAFVPLDPSQAADRRERVLAQIGAQVVLTSENYSNLAFGPGRIAVPVSSETVSNLAGVSVSQPLPNCTPKSAAYVIFTSGSTGQPKGVLVEHQAASSSCSYHGRQAGLNTTSRVLQFASHTFDAVILEIMTTLVHGGCVCVPSDSDRLADIEGCINRMNVNWVLFTPTLARQIEPSRIPSLQTIALGGEKVTEDDCKQWHNVPSILNAYGPTECAVVCCINDDMLGNGNESSMGRAVGSASWIVAADNHERLVPIGTIGELVVEGPILARGYIGDPSKTAAAFIDDPTWLLQGTPSRPGRHGRVYKTGDLVKYSEDGRLVYIGRKDNQVKIRGQRVELGEVEHHVRECIPQARHVAAEVVIPAGDGASPALAAFLVLDASSNAEHMPGVFSPPATLEDELAERLPAYMVPTVYCSLKELPLSSSGKTDRKELHRIGASFTLAQIQNAGRGTKRKPSTDIEYTLQGIWARVLNLDPDTIGIDDSFFSLGGDSISAMQVSAAARSQSISISSSKILQHKTISRLLNVLKSTNSLPISYLDIDDRLSDQSVKLSPIQHLYLSLQPDGGNSFDQCFLLRLNRNISYPDLLKALETIVQRHPALRARFAKAIDGHWIENITDNVSSSVHMRYEKAAGSDSDKAQIISQTRGSLNIEHGPLVSGVLFEDTSYQSLFLTIHHLSVDLVSWRVLFQELEELLTVGSPSLSPPLSFAGWCALQAQYAANNILDSGASTSLDVSVPFLDYWGMEGKTNLQGDAIVTQFNLRKSTSTALLGSCNNAFGTRPVELLISALAYTFSLEFSNRALPPIFTEGHGRESTWDEMIDISHTVGWFTTIFPIQITPNGAISLFDIIRRTKDSMRNLPQNGWSYFTSRFFNEAAAKIHASEFPVEIMFNFAGSYQQLERSDGLLEALTLPRDPGFGSDLQRFALLNLFAQVDRGQLVIELEYNKHMQHQERILSWFGKYEAVLGQVVDLLSNRAPEWTLSNFPSVFTSYHDIQNVRDNLLPKLGIERTDDIEEIFPCSPMQEGILISQAKDSRLYRTCFRFEVRHRDKNEDINLARLQSAWGAVVKKHALLRAVLIQDFPGTSKMMHIILKDPSPNISYVQHEGESMVEIQDLHQFVGYKQHGLQHHLTIIHNNDKVYLDLEINHAVFDAFSRDLLLSDFQAAYCDALDPLEASYKDFITYAGQQSYEASLQYWKQNLTKVEPCIFPVSIDAEDEGGTPIAELHSLDSNKILGFCADRDITVSTVIQTAWALVLREYTGSVVPCFGNLSSGRDVPIGGVDKIFGPLISMLPCRIRLDKPKSVLEVLKEVQEDYISSLPHQAFPLSAIHQALKLGPSALFNTAISSQRAKSNNGSVKNNEITIHPNGDVDPSEYDVIVTSLHSGAEIQIDVRFHPGRMTGAEAEQLASRFSQAISAIVTNDKRDIQEVDLMGTQEMERIWAWNATLPTAIERRVHEIIDEQAQAHPNLTAVYAWDGELTYVELDRFSTQLAHYLIQLGVGPEVLVPLCFEKSLWTIVAMLAVLKAGGAFVPLDPSQAADRRERVLVQTGAKVILTSAQYSNLPIGCGRVAVPVSADSISKLSEPGAGGLPGGVPTSAAYVIFTSGSTGQPKGVLVEHRAVSSSCWYHGRRIGFGETSRVLQFASYTFDACIMEILTTLVFGGCVCVPSDSSRLNDLTPCINSMEVNMAILTPTVARLISPTQVPQLKTMLLAGEKVSEDDCKQWENINQLINGYGPSECAVCCTSGDLLRPDGTPSNIGTAVGSTSWVVAADNHQRLVPIGTIGELVVEGPILARGYVADPTKTAAAFIENPTWLLQGPPGQPERGRRGRVYKTGDLVRYNEDGSLTYVGRKDQQVKIRGQRVELGEIEHHVAECLPQARQVAAEVIVPACSKTITPLLAAFLILNSPPSHGGKATVFTPSAVVEDQLNARLPGYMVPTVFFVIDKLPLGTSGKTDRLKLREIGASFTQHELALLRNDGRSDRRKPSTEIERTLQTIWARVLNIDPESISVDDSFFSLGGDSITAMQVSAAARAQSINISSGDILRSKTISHLLRTYKNTSILPVLPALPSTVGNDLTGQPVKLSPIQQLYLQRQSDGGNSFDQCFLLNLKRSITYFSLVEAIETILYRHPALRARFTKSDDGRWIQHITDDISSSVRTHDATCTGSDKAHLISQSRGSLNIENGPLVAAVLFEDEGHQSLFLTIHHLSIDLVSWRVLFQELEELLTVGALSLPPPLSFSAWCALQAQYFANEMDSSVSIDSGVSISPDNQPPLPNYWGMDNESNLQGNTAMAQFSVDESTSAALFGGCNNAFGTRPVELLMSALIYTFGLEFPDRSLPTIFTEGHGREPWDDQIDISRTIGWFTTIFPVQIVQNGDEPIDLLDAIRCTKDSIRSLPQNGWSYFTSRFADEAETKTHASEFPVEVIFNFAGSYQQLERTDALFEAAPLPDNCDPTFGSDLQRFALIDIAVQIERGQFTVMIQYHNEMKHQERILSWFGKYEAILGEMAEILSNRLSEWTLSDFPSVLTAYEDIRDIQNTLLPKLGIDKHEIEEIFPCSPMQEGILISQAKDSRLYRTCFRFEVRHCRNEHVDIERLELAWKAVVKKHALLRAILVQDFPGSSNIMHIILKDPSPSLSFIQHDGDIESMGDIQDLHQSVGYEEHNLQHHVTIIKVNGGRVFVDLEINHAIVDGFSRDILLSDLEVAYNSILDPAEASYQDFVSHISEQNSHETGLLFWKTQLDNIEPCFFPPSIGDLDEGNSSITAEVRNLDSSKILRFCAEWDITSSTIIQTAWALVLSQYTGSSIPCFGNISSGRDLPIESIDKIFGPLICMLPCRVRLDRSQSILETLKEVQEDYLSSLPHQTFPLSSMHKALQLGSSALFNTVISSQRAQTDNSLTNNDITTHGYDGVDPYEYDVSVRSFIVGADIQIVLKFRPGRVTPTDAERLASRFSQAISWITTNPNMDIQDINLIESEEIEKIWAWNSTVPAAGWIVAANDPEKLTPIGMVGELLVEGPILTRRYNNNPTQTSSIFIDDPAWLRQGTLNHPGRRGCLYKTGDLVAYSKDGSLVYICRKDDQAKIQGQQFDLGEVEHYIRQIIPQAQRVVAEVILDAKARNPTLAAFLVLDNQSSHEQMPSVFFPPATTEERLAEQLPKHMVPAIYFAIEQLPLSRLGKIDRVKLRQIGSSFSVEQLAQLRKTSRRVSRPSTETERALQALWARVLSIDPDSIGIDDNFFTLGGDSISAIKLATHARKLSIPLSLGSVFRYPVLKSLAASLPLAK
ncbi:hypothetical protein BGZ63DRAFT_455081 [Mariannaea sp. PMI_226]|nr:hypothetical protein BGZ63DRAFT_455081 [Mariannaea sp. PMI_226]